MSPLQPSLGTSCEGALQEYVSAWMTAGRAVFTFLEFSQTCSQSVLGPTQRLPFFVPNSVCDFDGAVEGWRVSSMVTCQHAVMGKRILRAKQQVGPSLAVHLVAGIRYYKAWSHYAKHYRESTTKTIKCTGENLKCFNHILLTWGYFLTSKLTFMDMKFSCYDNEIVACHPLSAVTIE